MSAPVCLPESVPELPPTPVPVVSNQSILVPESSDKSTPASEFHLDSLAKMTVAPEALAMSKIELGLRQTRLMSSVADLLLRLV